MKILLVNKFLYPKGGAETYVFKLGEILARHGHEVQYFGLEDERNIVGNHANQYVTATDLHSFNPSAVKSLFSIISNAEARRKLELVVEDFKPDVVHFNNIQFYLTPSMFLGVEKMRNRSKRNIRIVCTAHDFQFICPSHGLFDKDLHACERCLNQNYWNCFRGKCVKGSSLMSLMGTLDAFHWKRSPAYSYIDAIICPSAFMKTKLDQQERFRDKTVTPRNFISIVEWRQVETKGYILEFGNLSKDKGTYTLLEAAKRMPQRSFVFAGAGEAVEAIKQVPNATYVGFKKGQELETLIRSAAVSVCPSEIYDNAPFSVLESQMYGTPVVGADIGGIPELMESGRTGELFEPGNAEDLQEKLQLVLQNVERYARNCRSLDVETEDTYYQKLMGIYTGNEQ